MKERKRVLSNTLLLHDWCKQDLPIRFDGLLRHSVNCPNGLYQFFVIEIRLDSVTGTLVGTLPVTSTGGWQNWNEITTTVSSATGVHKVFFVDTGIGTGYLFDFDYWQFTLVVRTD